MSWSSRSHNDALDDEEVLRAFDRLDELAQVRVTPDSGTMTRSVARPRPEARSRNARGRGDAGSRVSLAIGTRSPPLTRRDPSARLHVVPRLHERSVVLLSTASCSRAFTTWAGAGQIRQLLVTRGLRADVEDRDRRVGQEQPARSGGWSARGADIGGAGVHRRCLRARRSLSSSSSTLRAARRAMRISMSPASR